MDPDKIIISGTGCALADFLFNGISFNSDSFSRYLSEKEGDGGLYPGRLVFTEELEKFSGKQYHEILNELIGNRSPDAFNVGGPSLVSLIHASQMLNTKEYNVKFFGIAGNDDTADKIFGIVNQTPLDIKNYRRSVSGASPFTDVFSDPTFDHGHGERTFINNIGAARDYSPDMPGEEFFNSHIVCFGGTALVPQIHDDLTNLLAKAKNSNCITLVNTVFDFRNEKNNPGKPWPLGCSKKSFPLIDILIMDFEEAVKISGQNTIEEAALFFTFSKVSSFIITNGAKNIYLWSDGSLFEKLELMQLPVSEKVTIDLKSDSESRGDTTGCGDNFVGGIIASLAWQLKNKSKGQFDLTDAVSWGVASGGFSCYSIGGTYLEKTVDEKFNKVRLIYEDYLKQSGT